MMNGQGQLLESYTRGVGLAGDIGTIVAVTHHAGSSGPPGTYYVHHNHRGDVIVTRSTGGATVGTYGYSAFGALTYRPGSYDVCRFKFSSKERDPSTGFYYYGYRFYAPTLQRWISRDPIGERGGLNVYGYALNDPAGKVDAYGKSAGKRCDKCEYFRKKLNVPESQRDENWVIDCMLFCDWICHQPGVPSIQKCLEACYHDCEECKIPDIDCIFRPPARPPGRPRK